jgi:hypothetical protein
MPRSQPPAALQASKDCPPPLRFVPVTRGGGGQGKPSGPKLLTGALGRHLLGRPRGSPSESERVNLISFRGPKTPRTAILNPANIFNLGSQADLKSAYRPTHNRKKSAENRVLSGQIGARRRKGRHCSPAKTERGRRRTGRPPIGTDGWLGEIPGLSKKKRRKRSFVGPDRVWPLSSRLPKTCVSNRSSIPRG